MERETERWREMWRAGGRDGERDRVMEREREMGGRERECVCVFCPPPQQPKLQVLIRVSYKEF